MAAHVPTRGECLASQSSLATAKRRIHSTDSHPSSHRRYQRRYGGCGFGMLRPRPLTASLLLVALLLLTVVVTCATAAGSDPPRAGNTLRTQAPLLSEKDEPEAQAQPVLSFLLGTLLRWLGKVLYYLLRPFYLAVYWVVHLTILMPFSIGYRVFAAVAPILGFLIVATGVGACIGGGAAWAVRTAAELGWGELPETKYQALLEENAGQSMLNGEAAQKMGGLAVAHRRPQGRHGRKNTGASDLTQLTDWQSEAGESAWLHSETESIAKRSGKRPAYQPTKHLTSKADHSHSIYDDDGEDDDGASYGPYDHDDVYTKDWDYEDDQEMLLSEEDLIADQRSSRAHTSSSQVYQTRIQERRPYRARASTDTSLASALAADEVPSTRRPVTPVVGSNLSAAMAAHAHAARTAEAYAYTDEDSYDDGDMSSLYDSTQDESLDASDPRKNI
ncbi:hypothetical protein THASP1DRAFT_29749 [Thamnocephalis sphaerospora]|uniref:Uncharacterized protein n=1 Tax=Thamnocephalis sphaerospora TaxID=78915 RepID=A0A4V1IWR2_9FUNG|nr:hypothetical protein THASP1DRAFT_29749 [Thamnocephalis sphaerospora]|eukprot:RKP08449.1 hypothetical protein THASP1DRAFT_29749 [Thamnocephalis sphaerospora]